jgi:hypothetical protein
LVAEEAVEADLDLTKALVVLLVDTVENILLLLL